MSDLESFKFTLEGPRWLNLPKAVKDFCFHNNFKYDIELDKGWLTVKVYVTLHGTSKEIEHAQDLIRRSVNRYNV